MVLPLASELKFTMCRKPKTRVLQPRTAPDVTLQFFNVSCSLSLRSIGLNNFSVSFSVLEKELSDLRESRKAETEKLTASLEELKVSMQKREAEMETLKADKTGLEREVADMNKLRTAKEELAQQLKVRFCPYMLFI